MLLLQAAPQGAIGWPEAAISVLLLGALVGVVKLFVTELRDAREDLKGVASALQDREAARTDEVLATVKANTEVMGGVKAALSTSSHVLERATRALERLDRERRQAPPA